MSSFIYDVTGIGNAIVDVLAQVDDHFLEKHHLIKGSMSLIDQAKAQRIYDDMPPALQVSGGSAANTIAGIASLGGKTAFIGKVHQDTVGTIFTQDIQAIGVEYRTEPTHSGPETARSFVAITPDAERTMATYLGAAKHMTLADMDAQLISKSRVIYLEGYLWDEPMAKASMRRAMEIAASSGTKVAFSLSDLFCVERHRTEFLALLNEHVDILCANEAEIKALFEADDLAQVLPQIQGKCEIAAITLGHRGSLILADKTYVIPPRSDRAVVDTTGAGDLYASGLLYGYVRGMSPQAFGELGSLVSSEIISHIGARPHTNLSILAQKEGFLEQAA